MESPLISVLIRTQSRDSLTSSVLSVLKQDYKLIHLVVVNDGGSDCEPSLTKLCQPYENVEFTYYRFNESQGRSIAANKAMSLAKGDFFLFLDDDDYIFPNHLSSLHQTYRKQAHTSNIIGTYSAIRCIAREEGFIEFRAVYETDFDANLLAFRNYIPIHSVLFSRTVYDQGCRFNSKLDLYEDWNFWVQVIRFGNLIFSQQITGLYDLSQSGVGDPSKSFDKNEDLVLFFQETTPFWQDHHWLYLYTQERLKQQLEENYALSEKIREKSQHDFAALEKDYLNLQEDYLSLQQEHQMLDKEVYKLNEKNRELTFKLSLVQSKLSFLNSKTLRFNKERLKQHMRRFIFLSSVFWEHIKQGRVKSALSKVFRKVRSQLTNQFDGSSRTNEIQQNHYLEAPYERPFKILATKHTLYVAKLIEQALNHFGFKNTEILSPEETIFNDDVHFVVCPQMFTKLPPIYVAFQMEQSVHSRWFTQDYFKILENALAVLDYSKRNIQFLQEQGKLAYQQLYWTPISNIQNYKSRYPFEETHSKPEYDVAFYGDIHNPRRKAFLDEIAKHYKLHIISEVFGDDLYRELQKAKMVLNIHYYEDALLETTRIYECLSLGLTVISEKSSDFEDHSSLYDKVRFTEIDDISGMCQAIQEVLDQPEDYRPEFSGDNESFQYYLGRMLLASDLMPRNDLDRLDSPLIYSTQPIRVGLSLPETYKRYQYLQQTQPNTQVFPGLRHKKGWIGAAMSYKYMAHWALKYKLPYLEACEDDVYLSDDFEGKLEAVKTFLSKEIGDDNWDIFCGIIADLHKNTKIKAIYPFQGLEIIELDHMTSMVFNLYNFKALKLIADWDPTNEDVNLNTIDRYLETQNMRVFTTYPFLVEHHEEQDSTLWGIQNTEYTNLISDTEIKLKNMIDEFKSEQ